MRSAFVGLQLGTAEERMSELEDISIESSVEKLREQRPKEAKQNICSTTTKDITCVQWECQKQMKEKGTDKYLEQLMRISLN